MYSFPYYLTIPNPNLLSPINDERCNISPHSTHPFFSCSPKYLIFTMCLPCVPSYLSEVTLSLSSDSYAKIVSESESDGLQVSTSIKSVPGGPPISVSKFITNN